MSNENRIEPEQKPRGFSLKLSFGRTPPVDDATRRQLREQATKDPTLPDATKGASDVRELTVDFSDGKLRVRDGERTGEDIGVTTTRHGREAEAWERLANIGTGAYPDTARLHRVLRRVVLALGLSVPVGLCILALASGQSGETVVFMTLGGLIVGMMFISSFPGGR